MADQDVNIIGFDGQTPPLWATEQTLEAMLEKIEDLVKIGEGQKRDLKDAIRGGGGKGGGKTDPKKMDNLFDGMSKSLKSSASAAAESAAGFDKLPGPMGKFLKGLKKTNPAMASLAIGVGIIGNQIGKAISSVKESVSTLRDLSDGGIRLEGSFMEMQRGLAESGMTIAEFGEITSKYANVINKHGFPAVSRLAESVNEASNGFSKWGLKLSEGTEIAADLIDQQRRGGLFEAINTQRQTKHIETVMDRLTAYSKVLNISRKEMLDSTRDMMKDKEYQFRISQMGAQEREEFNKGMMSVKQAATAMGEEFDPFMQVIKETAVQKIDAQSPAYVRLLQTGQTELAAFLSSIGNAAARGEEYTLQQIGEGIKEAQARQALNEAMFQAQGENKEVAMEVTAAGLAYERALDQIKTNAERGGKEHQESVDENVQLMTELDTSLSVLQASIEYTRVHGFMALMGDGAESGIRAAIKGIDAMTDSLMRFNDSGLMEEAGSWLRDHWKGALVAGGIAVMAFSKVLGMAGTGLTSILSKITAKGLRTAGAVGAAVYGINQAYQAITTGKSDVSEFINSTDIGVSAMSGLGSAMQHTMAFLGNDAAQANIDMMNGSGVIDHNSPEQKAIRQARRDAHAKAQADKSPETISTEVPSTPAAPSMSPTDVAKLDAAGQTNYYLSEILKANKKTGRMLAGEI